MTHIYNYFVAYGYYYSSSATSLGGPILCNLHHQFPSGMAFADDINEATFLAGSGPIAALLVPILAHGCPDTTLPQQIQYGGHLSRLVEAISVPYGAKDGLRRDGPAFEEDEAQVQRLDPIPGHHQDDGAVWTKDFGKRGEQLGGGLGQADDVIAAALPAAAEAADLVVADGSVASHLLAPGRRRGRRCRPHNFQLGLGGPRQLRRPRSDAAGTSYDQQPLALAVAPSWGRRPIVDLYPRPLQ